MIYYKCSIGNGISFGEGYVLPEGATELTREEWVAACDLAREPIEPSLAELKASLQRAIDAAAEQERLKYITAGDGQVMMYLAKAEEARRLAADADPADEDYPLLSAEVGITAETLAEVGGAVLAAYQQWLAVGAQIEAARLGAKRAIGLALDAEAARAVQASWPQP